MEYQTSVESKDITGDFGNEHNGDTDAGKGGGVFGSHAVQVLPLFPFTEWGENGSAIPGIVTVLIASLIKYKIPDFAAGIDLGNPNIDKANAAINANFILKIGESIAQIGASLAEILLIYETYVTPILNDELKLSVTLTNGDVKTFEPADLGISGRHPDYLNHILQYIKTKYILYHTYQPFVGIYHTVDYKEYSTADCGFTFEIAGGTGEFIYDIAENQEIIIQTAKSERMAGYDINGETQKVVKISGEGCEFVKGALSGGALYSMRAGNRSLQKLQWEPALSAPVTRQTNQRNTEILDGFITRFLYASETYPKKIRLISADGRVRAAQLLSTEAFYRESTYERVVDMQCFKAGQDERVYIVRVDAAGRLWLERLVDKIGRHGDVFLDSWREYAGEQSEEAYDPAAVIYDPALNRVYGMDEDVPDDGHVKYIGYKYMSKVRAMPAIGQGMLESKRVARINVRLLDSELPFFNGYPEGYRDMNKITDQEKRRSGVFPAPVPGTNHRDAAYEILSDHPDSLSILAIYEEER